MAAAAKKQKVGGFATANQQVGAFAESELLSCPCCYSIGDPSECGDCTPAGAVAKLERLREGMAQQGVAAYIVPSEDAHSSEYVAAADKRRAFLSGFTGSAGTAVVTANKALLWTDGRYFLQAAEQLTEAWTLQKMFEPGVLDIEDWLAAELDPGSAVGVDPALFKAATEAEYQAKWGTRLTIKHLPANLVDTIWMTRPIDPANNILIHPEALAGEGVRDKLARVRAALAEEKVAALILNALDQVRNISSSCHCLSRFAVRSLLLPRCVFLPSSWSRSPGCSTCGARISSATRCSLPTPSC